MSQDQWTAVDRYINELFVPPDPVLEAALQACAEANLPAIQVTPGQGKLLAILAQTIGARAILEIGTLGGYSTIWLGRALQPGGHLITLEVDPKHAEVARTNLARAGLIGIVELHLGRALETLPQLAAERRGPFDLVFIDADKPNAADYFAWALKLTRPGGLIITDNVVRQGALADANSQDENVQGMRRFSEALAAEACVSAIVTQTVGSKGYDGFAIALVKNK
jgi:predicted O-methyltransferase YrrM